MPVRVPQGQITVATLMCPSVLHRPSYLILFFEDFDLKAVVLSRFQIPLLIGCARLKFSESWKS